MKFLEPILAPELNTCTTFFHSYFEMGMNTHPDASNQLSRVIKVKSVDIKKKTTPPHNEFILVTARDLMDQRDRHFILERTVDVDLEGSEPQDSVVQEFVLHPDARDVFNAVFRTLTPLAVVGAVAVAVPELSGTAMTGLVATAATLAALPLVSKVSSDSPYLNEIPELREANSVKDFASLTVMDAFNFLSEITISRQVSKSLHKPAHNLPARDRWLGDLWIGTLDYGTARGARSFEVRNLSLFHLALLADVVHSQYPLYSLFKKNCYWFSGIFYMAARVIDDMIAPGPESDIPLPFEESKDTTDYFYMPHYMYLPQLAGRWMGFKVSEVQEVVVRRIVAVFIKRLLKEEREVCFYVLSELRRLLIF
jgi:hypothetical protein